MGVYAAVLALWPLVLVWFFAQLNGAHLKGNTRHFSNVASNKSLPDPFTIYNWGILTRQLPAGRASTMYLLLSISITEDNNAFRYPRILEG
jgi:hypothetical protein